MNEITNDGWKPISPGFPLEQPRAVAQGAPDRSAIAAAIDLTEKSILSEYYSGRLNGDARIREGFKNLRAVLAAQPPAAPVETDTIDSVPSCGQENDYRRAQPDQRSSAETSGQEG